ncbi:MAG: YwmB family TATA-box binding protein [Bacillus sp. (in: Bacteria)]|nr:YwmB family TATA-box binding protein [Bacillus sp. (in: firmicutes)]
MKGNCFGLLALFLGYILFYIGNSTVAAVKYDDLFQIVQAVRAEQGVISEWSIHSRREVDILSKHDFQEMAETVQHQFSEMAWEWEQSGDEWKLIGTFTNQQMKESVQLLSKKHDGRRYSYVTFQLIGTQWTDETKSFIEKTWNNCIKRLFGNDVTVFSYVKGTFSPSATHLLQEKAAHILQRLEAKETESLKEDRFVSISAYSKRFSQQVPSSNNDMNIQIGLRQEGMGVETTFVIGTPILTIEY